MTDGEDLTNLTDEKLWELTVSGELGAEEELFGRYIKKNEENFKRQYGASAKPGYSLFEGKRE